MARYRSLLCLVIMLSSGLLAFAQQTPQIKEVPAPYTTGSSGEEMYQAYCASCHGKFAKGDGPAASALKIPPTNLTALAKHNGGKFPSEHVATLLRGDTALAAHGSKEMPVWGAVFQSMSKDSGAGMQMRVSNLTAYIKSLQK